MQIQNQTHQITEEEFLLPLSEDELEIVNGGDLGDLWNAIPWKDVHRVVGELVDKAPPGPIATPAKLYKASALHNEEGHWWSFL